MKINVSFLQDPRIKELLSSKPGEFSDGTGNIGVMVWNHAAEVRVGSISTEFKDGFLAREIRLGRVKGISREDLEKVVTIVDASCFSDAEIGLIGNIAKEKCVAFGVRKPVRVFQVKDKKWHEVWVSNGP